MGVKEAFSRVRKAVAVAVAGGVVLGLSKLGVVTDVSTVEVLVSYGITTLMVYLVPNAKGVIDGR